METQTEKSGMKFSRGKDEEEVVRGDATPAREKPCRGGGANVAYNLAGSQRTSTQSTMGEAGK